MSEKVLIAHVPYQTRGGEDVHVEVLKNAYSAIGVEAVFFPKRRSPEDPSFKRALQSLSSLAGLKEIQEAWRLHQPRYIHAHNIYPTLGPTFLKWAREARVPLVMTVHNHRFFCTNGLALRAGKVCKDCFSATWMWRSVLHNCNGSVTKSLYYSAALTEVKKARYFDNTVLRLIAPSPYIRDELIRYGISSDRVTQITNPVSVVGDPVCYYVGQTEYDVFYAGRLSSEKGVSHLMEAAEKLPTLEFAIAGDGPEKTQVESRARLLNNVTFLGPVEHARVLELIRSSKVCVLPSICNEILPTFVLESFYLGRVCVVPDLESTRWLAADFFPGVMSQPGDPESLAGAITTALKKNPPSGEALVGLRRQLSFERFCKDLKAFMASFPG